MGVQGILINTPSLWQGRINPHVRGLDAQEESHVLGWGMLVQSLGVLSEGNITEWGIKALCSILRSFTPLCFLSHQKASPDQPSKGNCGRQPCSIAP